VKRRLLEYSGENGEGITEEDLDALPENFFLRECRTTVRSAEQIIERVEDVLDYYKDRLHPVQGDPARGTADKEAALVTEHTLKRWEEVKQHTGCLQDPEGATVYYVKAKRMEKVCGA
jgi:hypothetical protein